jgi:hypothetical protein
MVFDEMIFHKVSDSLNLDWDFFLMHPPQMSAEVVDFIQNCGLVAFIKIFKKPDLHFEASNVKTQIYIYFNIKNDNDLNLYSNCIQVILLHLEEIVLQTCKSEVILSQQMCKHNSYLFCQRFSPIFRHIAIRQLFLNDYKLNKKILWW